MGEGPAQAAEGRAAVRRAAVGGRLVAAVATPAGDPPGRLAAVRRPA
ncbi:hypothetical protein [Mycolicibacterium wolinskyi]|nr:hypothetical protein [Mycolicibacterium wolinskyi]